MFVLNEPGLSHIEEAAYILVVSDAPNVLPAIRNTAIGHAAIDLQDLHGETVRRADVRNEDVVQIIVCALR